MDGPGERPGGWDRRGRPAMAWTIAALSLLAAAFATNAHRSSPSGGGDLWARIQPIPIDTTPPSSPMLETVPLDGVPRV